MTLSDRCVLHISNIRYFVQRYQAHKSNPLLASALHRFGWVFGGSITSKRFGNLQHGKRITVQATAAGRRRKGAKKGKGPIIPGRPAGNGTDKHSMSVRNEPKGKRIHSLAKSITKGTQNAQSIRQRNRKYIIHVHFYLQRNFCARVCRPEVF